MRKAVEVTPGSVIKTTPTFDLHVSQIVLPASATDKGRTVLQVKVGDKAFALGSLKLDLQENVHTDLIFDAETEIQLSVSGKNPVQVLGYYVDNPPMDGLSDDDLEDDEGGLGIFGQNGDDDEDIDEDDDDEDDEDEEIDEDELTGATLQALTKRKAPEQSANGNAKKAKVEEKPQQKGQQQQPKGEQKPQTPKGEQKPQTPKGEQKPQQPKGEQKPQQPKGEQKPQQPKQQQKPQTPGKEQQQQGSAQKERPEGPRRVIEGVTVETSKVGLGAQAKLGQKVKVMYVGRLENGKVFDKSQRPFEFTLGIGDVIKGWDIGVNGMRVGEKRKLIIPPHHGYGARGSPPVIPKNATLEFDVELIKC